MSNNNPLRIVFMGTPDFSVPVSANLNFSSKGQPKDMVVWGDFTSGTGRYILIPIQSITGRFHNQGRHLSFFDVKVHTSVTTISTDALHIDNGELISVSYTHLTLPTT